MNGGEVKALLQPANFTLGPDATLNTEKGEYLATGLYDIYYLLKSTYFFPTFYVKYENMTPEVQCSKTNTISNTN